MSLSRNLLHFHGLDFTRGNVVIDPICFFSLCDQLALRKSTTLLATAPLGVCVLVCWILLLPQFFFLGRGHNSVHKSAYFPTLSIRMHVKYL